MIDHKHPVTIFAVIHTSILDGEVVLFNAQSGHFFALEESAGRLWLLLQKACTIEQVIDQLSEEGRVAEIRLFIELLYSWRERGLIRLPQADGNST
jgi:hypothetical protein